MRKKKPLVVIFQTIFIDLLGFGLVLPLLPLYAERFGATPFQVTSISASYSLMQFLFVPLWGRLSDRLGRRPILLISIAGGFVSYLLMDSPAPRGPSCGRICPESGANLSAAQAVIAVTGRGAQRDGVRQAAFGLRFHIQPSSGTSPRSLPMASGVARAGRWASVLRSAASLTNLILAYRWPRKRGQLRFGTRGGSGPGSRGSHSEKRLRILVWDG
jgi:MFS family permease